MLTNQELLILCLALLVLWLFPAIKLKWKLLSVNFLFQVSYSIIFLWLIENLGNKGSSLLWIFYWGFTILIHLVSLNIWTGFFIKKKSIK